MKGVTGEALQILDDPELQDLWRADLIVSLPALSWWVCEDGWQKWPSNHVADKAGFPGTLRLLATPHKRRPQTLPWIGTKVLVFLATHSASAVLTFDELGVSGRFMRRHRQIHFLYSTLFDLVLGIPLCLVLNS